MNISSILDAAVTQLSVPTEPSSPQPITEDQRSLIHAVKALNAAEMFGQENELTFVVDRAAHRAVVRIVNKETREVVEQIPDEYVLRLAEEMNRG